MRYRARVNVSLVEDGRGIKGHEEVGLSGLLLVL
jgi:hypothetical protein